MAHASCSRDGLQSRRHVMKGPKKLNNSIREVDIDVPLHPIELVKYANGATSHKCSSPPEDRWEPKQA